MEKIDIHNIPAEPTIQILNPDGSVLISTNCTTTFDYIRTEIKDSALEGYNIMTNCDNGHDEEIKVIEDECVKYIINTTVGIV